MTITEEPSLNTEGPRTLLTPAPHPPQRGALGPLALLDLLQDYVGETASLLPLAPPDLDERRFELLELTDDLEIWAIHWPQGRGLDLHDHGGSAGALWVVEGSLEEHYIGVGATVARRSIVAGGGAAFGPSYVHDVVNVADDPGDQRARLLSPHGVHDLLPPGRTAAWWSSGPSTGPIPRGRR